MTLHLGILDTRGGSISRKYLIRGVELIDDGVDDCNTVRAVGSAYARKLEGSFTIASVLLVSDAA
jgi:hypothetical protein